MSIMICSIHYWTVRYFASDTKQNAVSFLGFDYSDRFYILHKTVLFEQCTRICFHSHLLPGSENSSLLQFSRANTTSHHALASMKTENFS